MHTRSFTNPQFLKIGLTHKRSPVESPTVATCPFVGERRRDSRVCFPKEERCTESPSTFICGKRRKNRRKPVKMKILSSGVVFTFEEGLQKRGFCSYLPSIEEEIRPT
ncbi:hypothetical protein HKD37_01G000840 [Glycine soja]